MLIFFDFDGTIADSLQIAEEVIHELGPRYGLPPADREKLLEWKSYSVPRLLKETGIAWTQLPQIMLQAHRAFQARVEQVPLVEGMREVVLELHAQDHELRILTSNSTENVQFILDKYGLNVFAGIHAPNALFGKAAVINKIRKRKQLSADEIFMIGDEHRDIQAANEAGVRSIAVTWGFNTTELLQTANPTYCVAKPVEMLDYLLSD